MAILPAAPASHDSAGSVAATSSKLPLPSSAMAAAWDGQRYVYLFGGFTKFGTGTNSAVKRTEQIVVYDAIEDRAVIAPTVLPSARTGASAVWDPRDLGTIGCAKGCAYIFGGERGSNLDEIIRYNAFTNLAVRLEARLPTPRYGTVAVWTGEHAYLFGGGSAVLEHWKDILRFDPLTQNITTMNARLPESMHYSTGVWDPRHRPHDGCPAGCAYLFGGSTNVSDDHSEYRLDLVVQYNPTTDTVRSMQARLPSPRVAAAAAWDGTHAYIFGGDVPAGALGEVVRYDPVKDQATLLTPRLDPTRCCMSAVWVDSQAFLFGGTTPAISDDILRFHPPVANRAPVASFVTSALGLEVSVDASASSDPEGGALSFSWNWGDGASSVGGPLASHAYAQAGTYTIQLVVTDAAGSTGGTTRTVTLTAPPPPPAPSNQAPTASFTVTTNQLAVTTNAGASRDDDGTITAYAWDWGDGATGAGATATHTYATAGTYTIRLTVTDDQGATASATRSVTVTAPPAAPNQAPVAVFSTTSTGLAVMTDAAGSYDPDGAIAAYAWNWGDGATSTGVTASRTYAYAGTYTIRLTVTDNQGATASTTRTLTVSNPPPPPSSQPPQQPAPPPPNQAPVAAFSTTTSGLTVAVNAAGSTDSDGTITTYAWTWGDGATSTGPTATHTYGAAGDYTIELTLTDDQGATASTTRTIRATAPPAQGPPGEPAAQPEPEAPPPPPPPPPVPVLQVEADGLSVTANATRSHAPNATLVLFEYRWGDGQTTTTTQPQATHTYAWTGTYTVRLVVTDEHGNTNETATVIRAQIVEPSEPAAQERMEDEPDAQPALDASPPPPDATGRATTPRPDPSTPDPAAQTPPETDPLPPEAHTIPTPPRLTLLALLHAALLLRTHAKHRKTHARP